MMDFQLTSHVPIPGTSNSQCKPRLLSRIGIILGFEQRRSCMAWLHSEASQGFTPGFTLKPWLACRQATGMRYKF